MALALVIVGYSCKGFTESSSQPVAIEFVGAPDTVAVDSTVFVPVRVLNRSGDSIPGAPIALTSLDTLTRIDGTGRSVIGLFPGPARIVAASGSLQSSPLRITVKP
ncbi:MAG: hypothetical protein Q8Q85_10855 [Gemmatimonadales bacterium]|nr:hypothetical protein [Gemmatimonadales bacterium]